jgi:hypothetical protein
MSLACSRSTSTSRSSTSVADTQRDLDTSRPELRESMPALLADIARAIDQGELTVAQDRRRVRGVVDFVARDRRCHARRLAVGEANRSALPFAVEVAVSPMPVVAMVLMLITPRARANGITFVVGWVLGVAAGGCDEVVPCGRLLHVAVRKRNARPAAGAEVAMPKRWVGSRARTSSNPDSVRSGITHSMSEASSG